MGFRFPLTVKLVDESVRDVLDGVRLKLGAGFVFSKEFPGGLPDMHSLVHKQGEDFSSFEARYVSDDYEAMRGFIGLDLVNTG